MSAEWLAERIAGREWLITLVETLPNLDQKQVLAVRINADSATCDRKASELLSTWLRKHPGRLASWCITEPSRHRD